MDNQTMTACEKCKALIFYDKDAPEPKLCPVCEKKKREAEYERIDEMEKQGE